MASLANILRLHHATATHAEQSDGAARKIHLTAVVVDLARAWAPNWQPEDGAEEVEYRAAWPALALRIAHLPPGPVREGLSARSSDLEKAFSVSVRHPEGGVCARWLETLLADLLDAADDPHALESARLSDLIDFCFTILARIRYRVGGDSVPKRIGAADLAWDKVDRDMFYGHGQTLTRHGPVVVHVLRFAPRRYRIVPAGFGAHPQMLADEAQKRGAVAAVNGGYYLFGEVNEDTSGKLGEPVSYMAAEGRAIVAPALTRAALVQTDNGHVHARIVGLKGATVGIGNMQLAARAVNKKGIGPGEVVFYNAVHGVKTPAAPWAVAIEGTRVCGVSAGEGVSIPVNGFAIALNPGPSPRPEMPAVGSEVSIVSPFGMGGDDVSAAVSGGPMILEKAQTRIDWSREDFGPNLPPAAAHARSFFEQAFAPRLVAGLTDDHEVVFAAFPGRDFKRHVGTNLDLAARFLREIGCATALNLDGGGSLRMWIASAPKPLVVGQADATRPDYGAVFILRS